MKRLRVYMADMDTEFVNRVRNAVSHAPALEFVGTAPSGRRALAEISALAPDVLITDIPLPELDGIALLREVRHLKRPPVVIVCTRFYSSASMECACRHGASFFLCKPIDLEGLMKLIAECGRLSEPPVRAPREADDGTNDMAARAHKLLKEIGMPAKLNGGSYIIEAMVRLQENPLLLRNLSQGLYAQIAERMETTVSRVERSMRNAIDIACQRGSLGERFPTRPSNREFLEYLFKALSE